MGKHEGLPVHRHDRQKAATIFAFQREVDDWLRGRIICREAGTHRQLASKSQEAALEGSGRSLEHAKSED